MFPATGWLTTSTKPVCPMTSPLLYVCVYRAGVGVKVAKLEVLSTLPGSVSHSDARKCRDKLLFGSKLPFSAL